MAVVLTTDPWKKSRASLERRTTERKRIRWLALLIIVAVFGFLGWYFDLFFDGPVVVNTVVL